MLDDTPLFNLITDIIGNKTFQRKMITGAVDFVTGNYIIFDFDKLDRSEQPKAIMASASVPGAFPVTKIRNWNLIDGGTVWNLNIVSGIEKCQELGFKDEKDIVLDVIVLTGENMTFSNNT